MWRYASNLSSDERHIKAALDNTLKIYKRLEGRTRCISERPSTELLQLYLPIDAGFKFICQINL